MRLQLIVNPAAGRGRAMRALAAVQGALAAHDVLITPTRSLEHADELVAAAVGDGRLPVAFGGDGIVGRVAGAAASLDALIGALPGGRGNDFCRSVVIPLDPVAACAVLDRGTARPLDLGEVQSATGRRAFIGIASIGFDSDVQERAQTARLPIGRLVYLAATLASIATWRPATFTCTVDGEPLVVHGWSVAVANTGMYGGGMRLAPNASASDGRLDVVTTSATSRRRFLATLPKVFNGTHVHDPSIGLVRATTVGLDADRPFRVFADGDPAGTLPCTIAVRPAAVQVLLPG